MRFLFNQRTARVTAYLWRTLEMILSVHYTINNICETSGGYLAEFGTRLKQSFQHNFFSLSSQPRVQRLVKTRQNILKFEQEAFEQKC